METNKILAWGAIATLFVALISYHLYTLYANPFALSEEDFEYYQDELQEKEQPQDEADAASDEPAETQNVAGANGENEKNIPDNLGPATDAIPPEELPQNAGKFNSYTSTAGGFTFIYPIGWIVEQVNNTPSDIARTYIGVKPENRLSGDQSMYFRALLGATSMQDAQNKVYTYWQSVLNDVPKPFFKGNKEELDNANAVSMWRYLANFGRDDFYLYIAEIIPGKLYLTFERPDPLGKDKALSEGYEMIIQSLRPAQ